MQQFCKKLFCFRRNGCIGGFLRPFHLGLFFGGGGFGGSAIAIVKKSEAENFKKNVGDIYRDKIGYDASFYDAEIVDGTKRI